jgi:hypothetical protein
MKLTPWRFGCAVSTVWALAVFASGLVNLYSSTYAAGFLSLLQSIYPGYHYGEWGFWGVLVVTLYAALDAFIVGVLVAWFYNLYAKLGRRPQA